MNPRIRLRNSRTSRVSVALAVLSVGVAMTGAAAVATVEPGANGVASEVTAVRRVSGHLEVTFALENHGPAQLQVGKLQVEGTPDGTIDVSVVDPATGRMGAPMADAGACLCAKLPVFVKPGEGATSTVQVADPGGSTVTVLIGGFEPFLAVPVQGTGASASSPVTTLKPRSLELQPRTRQGAARSTGTRIDLDTDVLFAFDSAKLSGRADAALKVAVAELKGQSQRRLAVYGHTDGKGTPAYNLSLSTRRAQAVRAALAPLLGSGWTFTVKGLGETKPIAAEKTKDGADYPAGRALNRRVELTLLT